VGLLSGLCGSGSGRKNVFPGSDVSEKCDEKFSGAGGIAEFILYL
jgi:hypothetical protein